MLDEFESSARLLPPAEQKVVPLPSPEPPAAEKAGVQLTLELPRAEEIAMAQLWLELFPTEEKAAEQASLALAPTEENTPVQPSPEQPIAEEEVLLQASPELPPAEEKIQVLPSPEQPAAEEKVQLQASPELPPAKEEMQVPPPAKLPAAKEKVAVKTSLEDRSDRPFRVKLRGSILVLVRLPNKRSVQAALHQLSTSGGVIHFEKPLDEKLEVELIFHLQKKTIRSKAQLLFPMWATQGWMQPFRFVNMPDANREILDAGLKSFLSEGTKATAAGA